jgi:molybdopterin/thiamine biosynthesis adenylyltransferase
LVFGAVCLESHPIEIVETGAGSFTRNLPVLETTALESASVLCVGLGSGGSIVVDQLARAGVGQFVLWDMDRLESHNIGRHVCTLRDIGRRKVLAMRDHVLAVNPNAKVRCVDKSVLGAASASQLEAAVAAADCVVVGTDNNPSRFAVNDAAWRHGKPALFGRAFQRASGGDVIQVLPPAPPCYACQLRGRVVDEEISSKKDAARIPYSDVVVPVEPGLVIDIHPIANMLARLALLRLCEKRDGKLSAVAAEARDPLYLWANRREGQFARWRPMDRSYDRLATYRWYGINVRRDEECTTCGDGADAS